MQSSIKSKLIELKVRESIPKIIAVSKTFKIDHILPLIEYGHLDYGENKVQEALEKWTDIKNQNSKINLHLIGNYRVIRLNLLLKFLIIYIH